MEQEFLEHFPKYRKKGWTTSAWGSFVCPCGHTIEPDGRCPNNHVSPMLTEGII